MLEFLFGKKECQHRFKVEDVNDINNDDPKCTKCEVRFSKIVNTANRRFKFQYIEKEVLYGLIKQ